MPEIWTNSRLKMYQSCPMKEKLRYRDGLVPITKSEALSLGSAVHKGIETWSVEEAVRYFIDECPIPKTQEEADKQNITLGTIRSMLTGYFATFAPFEEHKPETEFSFVLTKPRSKRKVIIAGKIDDIVQLEDGQWLVEYKTASSIDKGYIDRLYVDTQISLYMLAAQKLGYKPKGIIYRVLKKPQIRQKKDETVEAYLFRMAADYMARPDFYFYEERLYRTTKDLKQFENELWLETKQADEAAKKGHYFKHSTSCSVYGTCPYMPLCTGEAGAEMLFEYKAPNEELEGIINAATDE